MTKKSRPIPLVFLLSFLALPLLSQGVAVHKVPGSYSSGVPLKIVVETEAPCQWAALFFRAEGEENFRSLPLTKGEGHSFAVSLETSTFQGKRLEYYFALKGAVEVVYLPEQVPETLFLVSSAEGPQTLPGEILPGPPLREAQREPSRTGESRNSALSVGGDLFGESTTLFPGGGASSSTSTGYGGNLKAGYRFQKGNQEINFEARAYYRSQDDPKADLPDLKLLAKSGSFALEVGEIAMNEGQFSLSGGRRGASLGYDDGRFRVLLFSLQNQRTEFQGIGIPRSDTALFGGSVGWKGDPWVSLKLLFLTGKDDPSLGTNNAYLSFYKPRKGSLISFIGGLSPIEGLRVDSEVALSDYDADTQDGEEALSGKALRVEGSFRRGFFESGLRWNRQEKEFGSIGLPFFTAGRENLAAELGLRFSRMGIGTRWQREETEESDNPLDLVSRNEGFNVDLTWMPSSGISLRGGFQRADQEAEAGSQVLPEGELHRDGITAGLDLTLREGALLSLSGVWDSIKSDAFPEKDGKSLSANIGLSFSDQKGNRFAPSFGYSRVESPSGPTTKLLNLYVSGAIVLVPQFLQMTLTGAWIRTAVSGLESVTYLNGEGGFLLEKSVGKRPIVFLVGIRGGVLRNTLAGKSDTTAQLHLDGQINF